VRPIRYRPTRYGAEYDQLVAGGTLIITIPPELIPDKESWIDEQQRAIAVTADRSVAAERPSDRRDRE
jgi:hypothetical protein